MTAAGCEGAGPSFARSTGGCLLPRRFLGASRRVADNSKQTLFALRCAAAARASVSRLAAG